MHRKKSIFSHDRNNEQYHTHNKQLTTNAGIPSSSESSSDSFPAVPDFFLALSSGPLSDSSSCLEHCGQKIIEIYEDFNIDVQIKEDNSPLTKADLALPSDYQ